MTDGVDVLYNKFNVDSSSPPDNPPQHPNSDYSCVVATTGQWRISRCDQQHHVMCQSDHDTGITRAVLSQGGPRDAAVYLDTYRILQRHRAVSLPQHTFLVGLSLQTAVNYLSKGDKY